MKHPPMTKPQIFELLFLMRSEWESAPMFRASSPEELRQKLELKAALWETAIKAEGIDYWLGKLALLRLLTTCKFPPTLAEFIEAAKEEQRAEESEIQSAFSEVVNAYKIATMFEAIKDISELDKVLSARPKRVIQELGGWEAFLNADNGTFNMMAFNETYDRLLRANPLPIGGGCAPQIGAPNE